MSENKKSEVSKRTAQTVSRLQTAIDQCASLPRDRLAKSKSCSLLVQETRERIGVAEISQRRR